MFRCHSDHLQGTHIFLNKVTDNIWCVYVCSIWRGMPDCSPAYYSLIESTVNIRNTLFLLAHLRNDVPVSYLA
jgi:hypothetical protein